MLLTELADNVRKHRRRAGMSQEELAHAAGVLPYLGEVGAGQPQRVGAWGSPLSGS
ncbi:hypothetical protein [Streptomyces sp. NBC_00385]|uniref:hypothetical protein n=1 Tax=Streptomyces sp. NBC_00385 TaxID=2975733 RepID=UPI002DDAD9EF|nr:hypothetical protein [Streptomyces sp. NBC_00385]WRZ04859.1 hypothetical protein OG959_16585 [Streptomyces sp. NBC_00385]